MSTPDHIPTPNGTATSSQQSKAEAAPPQAGPAEDERESIIRERDMLRAVVDNLPDLIYVKDRDSRYVLDNVAHAKFVGANCPEEVEGKSVFELFPSDVAGEFYESDQDLMRTGQSVRGVVEHTVDHEQNSLWVSTTKVPLRDADDRVIGLVGLSRDITERKTAQAELERTTDDLRRQNDELAANLSLAREFHQSLLPHDYPTIPTDASEGEQWIDFAHSYAPGGMLGGDFFDVRALDENRAGIFVCDVMGHDVRAALVAAILNAFVQRQSVEAVTPGELLTRINASLCAVLKRTDQVIFASAVYLIVDGATGQVEAASAGHPAPLWFEKESGSLSELTFRDQSPPGALGLFAEAEYATATHQLAQGDRLIAFTDGLSEVCNDSDEEFGEGRLQSVLQEFCQCHTLDESLDGLLDSARNFSQRSTFSDDVCIVATQWNGSGN
jgi:sigma-B regulation protein RsbU (phosphoserine phosphatase)